MGLRNTASGWGWISRLIHWSMAILIIGLTGLGLYMDTQNLDHYQLIQDHKSWGFLVFVLAVLRLAWRAVNPAAPALATDTPPWQALVVKATHIALYGLILAVPVTGWLMVSASPLQDLGVRNMVFGLFEMPDPYPTGDSGLTETFTALHALAWLALMGVLALHVVGALYHHFVLRDRVLARMVVGR
ncbi:MAG: cytochrome b [Pseudomonadota bacterium]